MSSNYINNIDMNKNSYHIFNKLGDKFMYKMRNHSLICIILLFFILIPFSFASDSNNLTYESKAVS